MLGDLYRLVPYDSAGQNHPAGLTVILDSALCVAIIAEGCRKGNVYVLRICCLFGLPSASVPQLPAQTEKGALNIYEERVRGLTAADPLKFLVQVS